MPGTTQTVEKFPKSSKAADIERTRKLRIKAGAISSTKKKLANGTWQIVTEWNVIGEG